MTWIDARRGVEQFTLDKLVSWRGDEDDEDDDIMEDVLREVIVISDDEGDESEFKAEQNILKIDARDTRFNKIPPEAVHTQAIDLTMVDDSDDSDDDFTVPYQGSLQHPHGHPSDRGREARIGQQRHIRWEEAVSRYRMKPSQALQHPSFRRPIQQGQEIPSHAYEMLQEGQSVALTNDKYMLRTINPMTRDHLGGGTHVSIRRDKVSYWALVQN